MIPNKYCLFVFFSLLATGVFTQRQPLDSLRQAFQLEKEILNKMDIFFEIATISTAADPLLGLSYADTLESMALKANNNMNLSRASYLRAIYYSDQGKFGEALTHHRKERDLAMKTDNLELQGKALNSLGTCFHSLLQNDSAIIYFVEAAKIKEKLGNMQDVAVAYSNIGNVFSDEKAPDKAIEWLEKALAIRLSLPSGERSAIITYNNLSVAYNGKDDYDKAIEYAQKGLELAESIDNKFLAGVLAGNLGHLWMEKGDLDKAIEICEKSIDLLKQLNRRSNMVYPYVALSEAWWRKGDFAKALKINQEGFSIVEELKLLEPLADYYQNFANVYESTGDYKQALFWFKKNKLLKDSLFNKEKLEAIANVETKFETKKKEAQLVKQQLQIEQENIQKKTIAIIAITALLVFIGLFQYVRSKQKIKQKETELAAQLEHAEAEKLREMDRLKSTFFANISHEFRTPLTLILSPVEQMISGTFRGDLQKYYRIIHRNGRRLLDLVNQLLDLSKLESGKLKLQVSEADLGKFVRSIAGSFESLAMRQQLALEVRVPEAPVVCFFDPDKVEKILVNLMTNAFKFTGEGGLIKVVLAVKEVAEAVASTQDSTMEDEIGTVFLYVKDTGIGIPAEQLPHLFERFTQSTVSELQAGSGIGLALTKELVNLHGGEIELESTEGMGTMFTVSLAVGKAFFKKEELVTPPSSQLDERPRSLSEDTLPKSIPEHSTVFSFAIETSKKPLLLLAEDHPDVRSYIVDTLSEHYKIEAVENGKLALEKALEMMPDLIITDLMMPVMSGQELCRLLKTNEKTSHIPLIMLTAKAEQTDKLEGLETGADDYLIKPFDARELKVRLSNLLEQRLRLQTHFRQTLSAFATTPVKGESMDVVLLRRIKETIEANLDDDQFSVVELASQVGMSRSQLHRKLSALTGFSPNEVIRNMRLERAKQLIEQKVGTVSEIAFLCGFTSPAYFIKCFREYFKTTPGEMH
ncbi:MAG: tetratricopeptide repeat protein [Saprospiraceae bacterium]